MMNQMTMVPTILMQIIFKEIIAKGNSSPLKGHFQVFHKIKKLNVNPIFSFSDKRRFLAYGMGTKNTNNCCPLSSG